MDPAPAPTQLTWRALLTLQDQVIARRQALRGGMTAAAWDWRFSSRRWQLVLPGVAVAHTGALTWEQRAWAAVLYGGEGAALSGDAAVRLVSGRGEEPERIDVVVPESCQRTRHGQFVPHRCSQLDSWRHPVRQPPQLRIAPAVLHSSAWAPSDKAAEWRLAAPVQRRLVRATDLRGSLEAMPRLRRRRLCPFLTHCSSTSARRGSATSTLGGSNPAWSPRWTEPTTWRSARGTRTRCADNDIVVSERHDRVLLLRFTTGNLCHDEPAVAQQLRSALLP